MNNSSFQIIEAIKKQLPDNANLIDFFTEILPMKKESAYRRLRGEVPLSLDEARKVASYLNLSLDKLLDIKQKGTYTSSIIRMNGKNLMESYCKTMERIITLMRFVKTDPNAKIYCSSNKLPNSHFYKFPTLCKFKFFKFAYQCRNALNPPKLSEIEIPSGVRDLEIIYQAERQQIETHYIWIRDIFRPILKDIFYFSEMRLVTQEEVWLLIEEIQQLLDDLEIDISVGQTNYRVPYLVYLADTYFDSNYIYIEGNNLKVSAISVFGINYLSTSEEDISNDTKEWIESLMRYSTLISKSGEIEKVNFFNQQRKIIEKFEFKKQI